MYTALVRPEKSQGQVVTIALVQIPDSHSRLPAILKVTPSDCYWNRRSRDLRQSFQNYICFSTLIFLFHMYRGLGSNTVRGCWVHTYRSDIDVICAAYEKETTCKIIVQKHP